MPKYPRPLSSRSWYTDGLDRTSCSGISSGYKYRRRSVVLGYSYNLSEGQYYFTSGSLTQQLHGGTHFLERHG